MPLSIYTISLLPLGREPLSHNLSSQKTYPSSGEPKIQGKTFKAWHLLFRNVRRAPWPAGQS